MNVYKRLQTCRAELKKLPIKESGENKFAGYKYMELADFLPHITDLCEAHGICPVISFGLDVATMTIFNSDKPEEQIVFTSPMSTAELKGCHQIQNLGAVETYLRRYLYVNAFDIVEHDALDSTHGKKESVAVKEIASSTKQESAGGSDTPTTDEEYRNRIKNKLQALYGDDNFRKKAALMEAAEYEKDGKKIQGKYDYHTMTGNPLKFLCYKIEKLKGRQPGEEG